MIPSRLCTAALALCCSFGAGAQSLGQLVDSTVYSVERAFARHSAELQSPGLIKRPAAEQSDLFPVYGFEPRASSGLTWGLVRVTDDTSKLCVTATPLTNSSRLTLLRAFSEAKLALAGSDCKPTTLALAGSAPTISGIRILDRRDTISASLLPAHPVISGVLSPAVTRPALIIKRGQSMEFLVQNPYVEVSPGQGLYVSLTGANIREGFSVSSGCGLVAPGGACTISVAYQGKPGEFLADNLRLEFSTGAVASLGVSGIP